MESPAPLPLPILLLILLTVAPSQAAPRGSEVAAEDAGAGQAELGGWSRPTIQTLGYKTRALLREALQMLGSVQDTRERRWLENFVQRLAYLASPQEVTQDRMVRRLKKVGPIPPKPDDAPMVMKRDETPILPETLRQAGTVHVEEGVPQPSVEPNTEPPHPTTSAPLVTSESNYEENEAARELLMRDLLDKFQDLQKLGMSGDTILEVLKQNMVQTSPHDNMDEADEDNGENEEEDHEDDQRDVSRPSSMAPTPEEDEPSSETHSILHQPTSSADVEQEAPVSITVETESRPATQGPNKHLMRIVAAKVSSKGDREGEAPDHGQPTVTSPPSVDSFRKPSTVRFSSDELEDQLMKEKLANASPRSNAAGEGQHQLTAKE